MSKHILLELAVREPHQVEPQLPNRSVYSVKDGYWILDGETFVSSSYFRNNPAKSKKKALDNGEDIKDF